MTYHETELERKMIELVTERHSGQLYSLDRPYTFHLQAARNAVLRFEHLIPEGTSVETMVLGGWGHDLIEDTETTEEELATMFGHEVASLIQGVTNEQGVNRKARHLATYPKIRSQSRNVFLKLCDRIVNIEAGGKTGMYRKEHQDFKTALYRENEFQPMWDLIETLLK